jgi:hypothetical protein
VRPWRLLIYPLRWKPQAFGEPIEHALNAAVDVGNQPEISRLDIRHRRRSPVKDFINPTHEALAQLIELGSQLRSQLRGHLLTLLAAITHCPLPSHALQEFSE